MAARLGICTALVLAFSDCSLAANYFVSTSGNNAWPGTATQPWRTLQFAADEVGPGDHVTVRPGGYTGFNLFTSGAPDAPIQFFAEPGVNITQPNSFTDDDGINLEGASHIVIDGFSVSGMPRAGVRSVGFPEDFAEFVTIRNVQATNNGVWGIFTGHVDDLVIESNRTSGSIDEHGIYVSNSGDRPVIRNNVSWNNRSNGIHMNGDLSQGGDGIISDALVSGNVIHGNGVGGGSGINMDGVQDSRIENNLLYNNRASGISLYSIDGAEGSTGNEVVNNTVFQAANGRWALNIQDGSTGNTVRNNILLHPGSRGAIDVSTSSLPGLISDYNVVTDRFTITTPTSGTNHTLTSWRSATGQDLHSIVSTAAQLFLNTTSDFHLLATAPAVNAGTSTQAPPADLDGQPRPFGGAFDVGAYEWVAATITGDFNFDGNVNAADYVAWQKLSDVPAGYQQWRQNFGEMGGGGGASPAPEPAASVLFCVGICIAVTALRIRSIPVRTKVPATLLRAWQVRS
jgi:parallel beta-helix repeat protein